jgi:microcystin-dependent protein
MKTKLSYLFAAVWLLATLNSQLSTAFAQTTAFTYQGQLSSGAGNANGNYDLRFSVYDANVAGNFIAGPITNSAVAVSNGLFTVTLNFGAGVFTGTNYWVEMGVRTNGGTSFATLVPRQQLTPTPYAVSAYNGVPPGSIMAYAGTTAPNGWLLCNTSVPVSRTTYAALFAAIGTNYGAGDFSTTFNLPDFRGRFLRGVDAGSGLDPDRNTRNAMNAGGNTGNAVGSIQGGVFGSHNHSNSAFATSDHQHWLPSGGNGANGIYASIDRFGTDRVVSFHRNFVTKTSDTTANTIESLSDTPTTLAAVVTSEGGNETRPVNAYVNYIIKY